MERDLARQIIQLYPTNNHQVFEISNESALRLAQLLRFSDSEVRVRSMMNQSLDGAARGTDETSKSIGNDIDFFFLTILRALTDVVVVGAETVRKENYRRPSGRANLLSDSHSLRPSRQKYPALALLTRSGEIPNSISPTWPTYLITDPANQQQVTARNPHFPASQIISVNSPLQTVDFLKSQGFKAIQLEGGPSILGEYLAAGLVDELVWTTSTITVGSKAVRVTNHDPHFQKWKINQLFYANEALVSHYLKA